MMQQSQFKFIFPGVNWFFSKVSDVQFLRINHLSASFYAYRVNSETTVSFFGMCSTSFRSTKFLVKRKNVGKFMIKRMNRNFNERIQIKFVQELKKTFLWQPLEMMQMKFCQMKRAIYTYANMIKPNSHFQTKSYIQNKINAE